MLGVVGYNYRQINGDSGGGAVLGPLKGRADAIGPGLSYSTQIGNIAFILNACHYEEFNVKARSDMSVTIVSGTLAF